MLFGHSDGFGSDLGRDKGGNKSTPKWPKLPHYRDKRGANHTFFKITPKHREVGFLVYIHYI